MFKLIRDILCVVGLIFLIKYSHDYYQERTKKPIPVNPIIHQTKTEKAISIAKKTSNKMMESLAEGLTTLGQAAKKAKFKTVSPDTQPLSSTNSLKNDLKKLITITQQIDHYLQTDSLLDNHRYNHYLSLNKELETQCKHLTKQIDKTAPTDQAIFDKTIARKAVALTHKLVLLTLDLVNETTDEVVGTVHFTTVSEGIDYINQLIKLLVS